MAETLGWHAAGLGYCLPVGATAALQRDRESWMSIEALVVDLRNRLEDRTASAQECLTAINACTSSGRPIEGLHLADCGIMRFPTEPALRQAAAEILDHLQESEKLADVIDSLPTKGDVIRANHARVQEIFARHHGPESARPATADFFQCVLLKNLCHTINPAQPLRNTLMRIADHHGRRAAAEVFGDTVGLPAMRDDQTIAITLGGRTARFRSSSSRLGFELLYFFALEPGMIRWIAGFDANDVFLDVGANIGKYSVIAAVMRHCRTYALEPFSANFEQLESHIELNGIGDRVVAMQAALSDRTGEGDLSFSKHVAGAADQVFDESRDDANSERVPGYRLDDLVADGTVDFPTHVKIDVDGTEHRVIAGMEGVLDDRRLKSIRLEIRLRDPRNAEALQRIRDAGFSCVVDDDEKNMLCRRD